MVLALAGLSTAPRSVLSSEPQAAPVTASTAAQAARRMGVCFM
jgi:hypothetical protein